jgi:hypothetical protein
MRKLAEESPDGQSNLEAIAEVIVVRARSGDLGAVALIFKVVENFDPILYDSESEE